MRPLSRLCLSFIFQRKGIPQKQREKSRELDLMILRCPFPPLQLCDCKIEIAPCLFKKHFFVQEFMHG